VEPRDERFCPPSFISAIPTTAINENCNENAHPQLDPLSLALHRLAIGCTNLTTIKLSGKIILGAELFWPYHGNDLQNMVTSALSAPLWPNLEELCVSFNTTIPSPSSFYFNRHAGSSISEDSDEDRDDLGRQCYSTVSWLDESDHYDSEDYNHECAQIPAINVSGLLFSLTTAARTEHMPRLKNVNVILYSDPRARYLEVLGLAEDQRQALERRWEVCLRMAIWWRLGFEGGREPEGFSAHDRNVVGDSRDCEGLEDMPPWWRECYRMWVDWVGVGGKVRVVRGKRRWSYQWL